MASNNEEIYKDVLKDLMVKEESLTGEMEIRLINEIKNDLLDALSGFIPNLNAQIGSQFESHTIQMRDNNEFLRERVELNGFLDVYKLKLEFLTGMLHKNKHDEGDAEKPKEGFDDLANIRSEVKSYESKFENIYAGIKREGMEKINLSSFKKLTRILSMSTQGDVEWQKKPGE